LRCLEKIASGERKMPDLRYGSAGGRLGAQALYVILENVIRNTAKHSLKDEEKWVNIYMTVKEYSEDLYEAVVWDTCGSANRQVGGKLLVKYLNDVIDDPIIDENGEVRPANWGVREMLICAAYLRQIPLENIEQRPLDLPLLAAVCCLTDTSRVLHHSCSL